MENKLLIFIVAYQRKSYTQGTIELLNKVRPEGSTVIVCDNGSTDGTREWLEENQETYNLGLIFAEENLRVGGAWMLLTQYFQPEDFTHILLLDNDGWFSPFKPDWFEQCLEIFATDPKIASLGLQRERKPGFFSMEKTFDPYFDSRESFNDLEIYDTIYFAAFRLDKFDLWHEAFSNWPHTFVGDKLNTHYISSGYRSIKVTPGFVVDISEYNFNNSDHAEYNKWFYERERDAEEFKRRTDMHSTTGEDEQFVINNFGQEYIKFLS